jgi:predicted small secreted protein
MIPRKLSRALALLAALGLGPALVACDTIEGAGEDASPAGRVVSSDAKNTKGTLRVARPPR